MERIDLTTAVLEITALNSAGEAALNDPYNENFLVRTSDGHPKHRRARESTPLANSQPARAVLCTDHYPFDPQLGWVFGRGDDDDDGNECDFHLGVREQGVSRRHFRIDHNWKAMTLVLTNLSGNGTRWTNPENGEVERVRTSRVILPEKQHSISAGVVDLVLRIPSRNEEQQASYEHSIYHLRKEVEKTMPTVNGLKVQLPGKVTPMVVGRKRKFVLGKLIGSGAMAFVREAIDYETGDTFAAKEYKLVERAEIPAMLNEIKLLQKLKHENVIEYIDLLKDPDPILIMAKAIRSLEKHKITSTSECVTLLRDSLAGLAYLHDNGIIHRDIKPANILLTNENPAQWKLADLGLSKIAKSAATFCGTPLYLAPEIDGLKYSVYTTMVDIWALGVVGIEYTCGFSPDLVELLDNVRKREPFVDAISHLASKSPLAEYLRPMLERNPERRPSAANAVEVLKSYQDSGKMVSRFTGQHEGTPSDMVPRSRATMP